MTNPIDSRINDGPVTDPLVYWTLARGYELSPAPLDEKSIGLAESQFDDFDIEATLIKMERYPDAGIRADAARLRSGVRRYGLARHPRLYDFWRHLASTLERDDWKDAAHWLWGPPARANKALYVAASEMGRGPIRRALSRVGWTTEQLRELFVEWLQAARVHKNAEHRAWQVFDAPHAPPVTGRTEPNPPTTEMWALATQLANNDRDLAQDVAQVLPWIAARAQGTDLVSLPTEALTQGSSRHPDAPGISARRGRKVWRTVQPIFLRRTRGHRAGHFPAEFQIAPRYFSALGVT